jgi:hypothetical protein
MYMCVCLCILAKIKVTLYTVFLAYFFLVSLHLSISIWFHIISYQWIIRIIPVSYPFLCGLCKPLLDVLHLVVISLKASQVLQNIFLGLSDWRCRSHELFAWVSLKVGSFQSYPPKWHEPLVHDLEIDFYTYLMFSNGESNRSSLYILGQYF